MSERLNAEIVAYLPFIRKILAAKRHSIGLTQDDLNEQLGYADRLVSKWECGDRNPSTFAFECWTNTLQIDVADLLRESKEQYENHYGDRSGHHRCSNDNTIRVRSFIVAVKRVPMLHEGKRVVEQVTKIKGNLWCVQNTVKQGKQKHG